MLILCLSAVAGCTGKPGRVSPIAVREERHQVGILDIGSEALVARVHLIRSAKTSVKVQTFIWKNDAAGRWVMYELIQAAKRGVRVQVLADQLWSEVDAKATAYAATAHANLEIKLYSPAAKRVDPSILRTAGEALLNPLRLNQRMHNKVIVADSSQAIIGGRNIADEYFDCKLGQNFRDRDALVIGPVVADMEASFDAYWAHPLAVSCVDLVDVAAVIRAGKVPRPRTLEEHRIEALHRRFEPYLRPRRVREAIYRPMATVGRVAFIADIPGKNDPERSRASRPLVEAFASAARNARESVLIQTAYLVMSHRGLRIFEELSQRGVPVTVSTNSLASINHWPVYGKYYQQQRQLIRDLGLHIYELKPLPGDIATMWPTYAEIRAQMQKRPGRRAGASVRASSSPDGTTPDLASIPHLCLHSKSFVIDSRIACISSYNLDPRSAELNTEIALLVWDRGFAKRLSDSIAIDMRPANSWVVWKRQRPVGVREFSELFGGLSTLISDLTTVDLWPAQYASCFELRSGAEPLWPGHPDFYAHYEAVGNFPWLPVGNEKRIYVRLFKAFGGVITPVL